MHETHKQEERKLLYGEKILDKVGSIEVGKRACLTVLDKDIFTIPTREIGSIDPVCTYFDGQEMHFPNPVKK